jgi:tRNA (mo5U34)-methyltransferase
VADPEALRARVQELAPWYQNIELAPGVFTKDVGGERDIYPELDHPAPMWKRSIAPRLGDMKGKRVLDIGCNAGYMSFEAKRLGAEYVLGVDSDLGATTSFIDQAEFCRDVLGLDVEFRNGSFFDLETDQPFDVVLFIGVLYHLEDWAGALDKVRELAAPGGRIVLESAIEPMTRTYPGSADYKGDAETYFVPSLKVLRAAVEERGFKVRRQYDLEARGLLFLSVR